MGKIRALILLRNREWRFLSVAPTNPVFTFRDGLYVLKSEHIREGNRGPEAIYFEDNPTPLNPENKDDSSSYLDDEILDNYLAQVHGDMKKPGLNLFGWLRPLTENPGYLVLIILGAVVLWAFYSSGWKI